jgi:hypothetical protein
MRLIRTLLIAFALLPLPACGADEDSGMSEGGSDARQPATVTPTAESGGSDSRPVESMGDIPITATASVAGRALSAEGTGECRHAGRASIYGVPSEMWLVQYRGDGELRGISLTLWRPTSGAEDQLSLSIDRLEETSRISTVQGGEVTGSGSVELDLEGDGGRFRVEGRDGEGRPVTLDLRCSSFGSVEAVGG